MRVCLHKSWKNKWKISLFASFGFGRIECLRLNLNRQIRSRSRFVCYPCHPDPLLSMSPLNQFWSMSLASFLSWPVQRWSSCSKSLSLPIQIETNTRVHQCLGCSQSEIKLKWHCRETTRPKCYTFLCSKRYKEIGLCDLLWSGVATLFYKQITHKDNGPIIKCLNSLYKTVWLPQSARESSFCDEN